MKIVARSYSRSPEKRSNVNRVFTIQPGRYYHPEWSRSLLRTCRGLGEETGAVFPIPLPVLDFKIKHQKWRASSLIPIHNYSFRVFQAYKLSYVGLRRKWGLQKKRILHHFIRSFLSAALLCDSSFEEKKTHTHKATKKKITKMTTKTT